MTAEHSSTDPAARVAALLEADDLEGGGSGASTPRTGRLQLVSN